MTTTDADDLKSFLNRDNEAMMEGKAAINTDRELYRENRSDPLDLDNYYADSVFVTENGAIGMNAGGHVIILPIKGWHKAIEDLSTLQTALVETQGAMRADDERLQLAGERVGLALGCDTPDWMADEILALRERLAKVMQPACEYNQDALTPEQATEQYQVIIAALAKAEARATAAATAPQEGGQS
jgi:hypothetical protein